MDRTKKVILMFDMFRKKIPENLDHAHEYLNFLEKDALKSLRQLDIKAHLTEYYEWVNTLQGFSRGLLASEIIELEDIDDLDRALEENGFI